MDEKTEFGGNWWCRKGVDFFTMKFDPRRGRRGARDFQNNGHLGKYIHNLGKRYGTARCRTPTTSGHFGSILSHFGQYKHQHRHCIYYWVPAASEEEERILVTRILLTDEGVILLKSGLGVYLG